MVGEVVRRRALDAASPRRHVAFEQAVVGWRYWGVALRDGEWRLRSPFRDTPWPVDSPLVAECHSASRSIGRPSRPHDPPGEGCRCGVYGGTYRALRSFLSTTFVPPAESAVIGRTLLWGDVVEEESSWRAAYGYPDRLLVPTLVRNAYKIAEDLEAYHVPVLVLDLADTFATLNPSSYLRGT